MAQTQSNVLLSWPSDPNTSDLPDQHPPEIQEAIADQAEVQRQMKALVDERRRARPVPELLHHYTNAAGLLGIAFNRELWFGDYRATNDVTEGRHAAALVQATLTSLSDEFGARYLSLFAPLLPEHEALSIIADSFDQRYIACFTEAPDHLPQWIHYGAEGFGYCVGMEAVNLSSLEVPLKLPVLPGYSPPRPAFFPVVYEESVQKQEVERLLDLVRSFYHRHAAPALEVSVAARSAFEGLVVGMIQWITDELALDYKSSHFEGELEWRCVVKHPVAAGRPKVRVSGNRLVSYVPVAVQVKTIKAGPRADLHQLRSVCMQQGVGVFEGIEITKSSIPLR